MTQKPETVCEQCGAAVPLVRYSSHEFCYVCACGNAGVISWFHGAEAPDFQPAEPQQIDFFDRREQQGAQI